MFPCRGWVAPCQRAARSIKGLPRRCQTGRRREASPPNSGRTWWAHFDFTLDWSSAIRPAADLTQQTENRHRAIASALQEQLGLTIVPATVDVDVLVIDSAARPPGL